MLLQPATQRLSGLSTSCRCSGRPSRAPATAAGRRQQRAAPVQHTRPAPSRAHIGACRHGGRPPLRCRAAPEGGEDLADIMKQDMERFAARQQQQQGAAQPSSSASQEAPQPASGGLKEAVDKLLIADFFFVLFILAWLGVGLVVKGALHSDALIDAWMPLWPLLWQPAIGVLMAGALVSGGLSWLASQSK